MSTSPDGFLRDRNGATIGRIRTEPNGRQVIENMSFNRLGYYDPKTNFTYDRSGNKIGTGNLLVTLLSR